MDNRMNRILEKINVLEIELDQKINLDKVKNYEKRVNIIFPQNYILYLTKIQNGGSCDELHTKGPYYGIYSFEESIEMNTEWEVDINKEFKLSEDIEMVENEDLLKQYQHTGTLNGTIPICTYGCGVIFRLIVNGNKSGEIMADAGTIEGDGYYFMNVDLLTFYENWLDKKLKYGNVLINAYYPFLEFGNNEKYKKV
jgi:hypothetical protein